MSRSLSIFVRVVGSLWLLLNELVLMNTSAMKLNFLGPGEFVPKDVSEATA